MKPAIKATGSFISRGRRRPLGAQALQVATSGGGRRSRPLTPDLMARGRLGGDKAGPSVRPIKRRLWTMKRNLPQRMMKKKYFHPQYMTQLQVQVARNYKPDTGDTGKTFRAHVVSLFYLGGAVAVRWNREKSWKIRCGETVNKKVLQFRRFLQGFLKLWEGYCQPEAG